MSTHPPARAIRARRLLFGAIALTAVVILSCSESQEPLQWRDAVRGGLGPVSTRLSTAAVTTTLADSVAAQTGGVGHFLVGKIDRSGTTYTARAFLRWDLTSLSEGEVTAAHLNFAIASVDLTDPVESGPFELRLFRVTGAWSQDSLSVLPLPPVDVGTPIAEATIDTSGLAASAGILVRANLFGGDSFNALVQDWLADSSSNFGVMVRLSSSSPSGILRFFASEGRHPTSGLELLTPLIDVTVRDTDTTTTTLEAIADAYVMTPSSPPAPQPDSVLFLGGGVVSRVAMRVDPLALLGVEALPRPPADALLSGVLRMRVVPEGDWSLPAGQSVTIRLFEAKVAWDATEPVRTAVLGSLITDVTVAGEDSTVEFGIAPYLRGRIEGRETDLVFIIFPEVDRVGSILLRSAQARTGRPEIEAGFGPIGRRWGR